jgi:UDP-N-acetylmuramoyl-tripeptide--D-alanyl-D-alanine ligase
MKTEQLYKIFREESTGVSTDTRSLKEGEIFFALWGQNYNGNKYAGDAIAKGASCAVIDDPTYETEKTMLVDDCLIELQSLALHHRKQMNATVLAITGTNGKTTTKELIAAIMSRKMKVHATKGNLNNEIGLPLTILSAPDETEMLILEMGANHIGEIRTLCNIARPDMGIITNIGTAHLEGFGSFDGVIKAKTELYESLKKVNGIAIYNDMNPLLAEKIYKLVNRAVPYSDPTGVRLEVEPAGSELNLAVKVVYQNKTHIIQTNLFGIYNLENVKAAIATGLFLGATAGDIADAITKYQPGNNRSQMKKTESNTLICDSYNANPTSMMLALKSFSEIRDQKKVVILGDMLELGEKSEEEHSGILDALKSLNHFEVLLVGNMFGRVASGSGYRSFNDVESLRSYLKEKPVKGSYILIKGSRRMTLEKIYDLL